MLYKDMSRKPYIFTIALLTLITACKKKEQPITTPETATGNASCILHNRVPDSVYLQLNGLDIATGTIPHILNLTIAPSDSLVVSRSQLKDKFRYRYYWNTNDYTYSDWFQFGPMGQRPGFEFDYYADSTDYKIDINGSKRNDQLICLDGDGVFSTWKAIDAYDWNKTSVWDTLSTAKKNHRFVISRFYTIKHYFTDTANKDTSITESFWLDTTKEQLYLNTTQVDKYILTNHFTSLTPLITSAFDTLFYCTYEIDSMHGQSQSFKPPFYMLVRTSVEK